MNDDDFAGKKPPCGNPFEKSILNWITIKGVIKVRIAKTF